MLNQKSYQNRTPERSHLVTEQARIAQLENSLLGLKNVVSTKAEHMISHEWLRDKVLLPFKLLEKTNDIEDRGFSNFVRSFNNIEPQFVSANGVNLVGVKLPSDRSFFYQFADDQTLPAMASYRGSCRLIKVFHPISSLIGLSGFYHELIHLGIDNTERSAITNSKELSAYLSWEYPRNGTSKPDMRLPDECWAYGCQIEFLNIMTDGLLEQRHAMNSYRAIASKLGASSETEYGLAMMLIHLGQMYYRKRPDEQGGQTKVFKDFFVECMKVAGRTIHYDVERIPSADIKLEATDITKLSYIPDFVLYQLQNSR